MDISIQTSCGDPCQPGFEPVRLSAPSSALKNTPPGFMVARELGDAVGLASVMHFEMLDSQAGKCDCRTTNSTERTLHSFNPKN